MSSLLFDTDQDIAIAVGQRVKYIRKLRKISQQDMALQSGVSYGSIKRFEQTGEISFVSLIKIARVLDELSEIDMLFPKPKYKNSKEVLNDK